jgi:hypothetical protein
MVGHDVCGLAEPEIGDLGKHFTLARNGVRQHHVEGRQAVGSDDQQAIARQGIDVPHFAAMDQLKAGQVRLQQGRGHGALR